MADSDESGPQCFPIYLFPRAWEGGDGNPRQVMWQTPHLLCNRCGEGFAPGDFGRTDIQISDEPYCIAEHRECYLRGIYGSVGHQQQRCPCFGGTYEDPPDMTPRQAARAAVVYHAAARHRVALSAFKIGTYFRIGSEETRWRVTDVGTRTLVAIKLDEWVVKNRSDVGPPYAVTETAFDEYDLPALQIVPAPPAPDDEARDEAEMRTLGLIQ